MKKNKQIMEIVFFFIRLPRKHSGERDRRKFAKKRKEKKNTLWHLMIVILYCESPYSLSSLHLQEFFFFSLPIVRLIVSLYNILDTV